MINDITFKWCNQMYVDEPISYDSLDTTKNISYVEDINGRVYKVTEQRDGNCYVQYFGQYNVVESRILLVPGVIEKTRIVQDTEERLLDYIYGLDKFFIKENKNYIYSIVQEKAYELSEVVLDEALENDYGLFERSKDNVIEELISFIDFEELYEVIDNIADSSNRLEDFFKDTGLSMADFI